MGYLFGFSVVMILLSLFGIARNNWVFRTRTALIFTDWSTYKKLPSYNYMFWRIWIWDVRRFIK